jgi:CxxC motif-containing protein (DUF1111 family)
MNTSRGRASRYSIPPRYAMIGPALASFHQLGTVNLLMARWLSLAILVGLSAQAGSSDTPIGAQAFADRRNPPSYRLLDAIESAQVNLGQSVFDTQWLAAGVPGSAGRVGVGPLFNAASCTSCHDEGGRGRGPAGDGTAPIALVMQLEAPPAHAGEEPSGDPVYGQVFNTSALGGVQVEGAVMIRYSETAGYYYPFGGRWSLRVPHYHLVRLNHGPLSAATVIKPRLAPALFGAGLLEAVPASAISEGAAAQAGGAYSGIPAWQWRGAKRLLGRLGWQGDAVSIRDQTTRAFAREMGLTSNDRPDDDCTPAEADCRAQPNGGSPEISEELLDAVVTFVGTLAVPESPVPARDGSSGPELFTNIGCAACHRPQLPVELPGAGGTRVPGIIAPYTDLRLHDLGLGMADENASGVKVISRWRTAPLWGSGYRLKMESHPTFLHDGRARSAEEAILWHSGEGARARYNFLKLGPRARETLLRWVETR